MEDRRPGTDAVMGVHEGSSAPSYLLGRAKTANGHQATDSPVRPFVEINRRHVLSRNINVSCVQPNLDHRLATACRPLSLPTRPMPRCLRAPGTPRTTPVATPRPASQPHACTRRWDTLPVPVQR